MNTTCSLRARLPVAAALLLFSSLWLVGSCQTSRAGQLHIDEIVDGLFVAQVSGVEARLRGLSVVDQSTAWACGTGGTCIRTTDGGVTWERVLVPAASKLDFRDVEAFSAERALLMAVDTPAQILLTEDGGRSWITSYRDDDEDAFLDGIAFWDTDRGVAFGDPTDGEFTVLRTVDGGRTWMRVPGEDLPNPEPGEVGFAGSGTGVTAFGRGGALIGTGGKRARILRSADYGRTWRAESVDMLQGSDSTGVFAVAMDANGRGLAVGGDFRQPNERIGTAVRSDDGGVTWVPPALTPPLGYRSGVAFVPSAIQGRPVFLVVGETGVDVTTDGGRSFQSLQTVGFDTVDFAPDGTGYASGEDGRVAKFVFARKLASAPLPTSRASTETDADDRLLPDVDTTDGSD